MGLSRREKGLKIPTHQIGMIVFLLAPQHTLASESNSNCASEPQAWHWNGEKCVGVTANSKEELLTLLRRNPSERYVRLNFEDASFLFTEVLGKVDPNFGALNVSGWDVSRVTSMEGMFLSAELFNQPLNNWNTSNVRNMISMFENATSFNQPLNNWNTSNVQNMSRMFSFARSFDQPLNSWNTSNVQNMGEMFRNARSFNQPLNSWNVAKVWIMRCVFCGASAFSQPLDNWEKTSKTYVEEKRNGEFSTTTFERNVKRISAIPLWVTLPVAYTGLSIYMREKRFGDDPEQNPMGTFNTFATMIPATAVVTTVSLGILLSSASASSVGAKLGALLGSIYFGIPVGLVAGTLLSLDPGVQKEFKTNRGLYYLAPTLSLLASTVVIRF